MRQQRCFFRHTDQRHTLEMLEAAALVTSTERMGYAMLMVSAIA
jgi:hypothetical protein